MGLCLSAALFGASSTKGCQRIGGPFRDPIPALPMGSFRRAGIRVSLMLCLKEDVIGLLSLFAHRYLKRPVAGTRPRDARRPPCRERRFPAKPVFAVGGPLRGPDPTRGNGYSCCCNSARRQQCCMMKKCGPPRQDTRCSTCSLDKVLSTARLLPRRLRPRLRLRSARPALPLTSNPYMD
jgi:hypothetical protein